MIVMMMIKEKRAGIASAAAIVIGLPHLLGRSGSVPVVVIVSIPLTAAIATVQTTTIGIAISTIIVVIVVVG